jgi:hypothetical protein
MRPASASLVAFSLAMSQAPAQFTRPASAQLPIRDSSAHRIEVSKRNSLEGFDTQYRPLTCGVARWTNPRRLAGRNGGIATTRWPSLTSTTQGVIAVGTNIPEFVPETVPPRVLQVWELGGRRVPPPPGKFTFAWPIVVPGSITGAHLLWLEPKEPTTRVLTFDWPAKPLTSIWVATFDVVRGWSAPREIARGIEIQHWSAGASSQSGAPPLVTAVVRRHDRPGFELLLIRHVASEWQAVPLDVHANVTYGAAVARGDTLLVSYIAPYVDHTVTQDRNSVLAVRSQDGGRTWLPPVLVSRSGAHGAYDPKLLSTARGMLRMLWRQQTQSGDDRIALASSADAGATWVREDDFTPPPGFTTLRAIADACGGVEVIYEDWHGGGENGHLDYIRWNGRWARQPEHLFTKWTALDPALTRDAHGRLVLVFLGRPPASTADAALHTLFSLGLP